MRLLMSWYTLLWRTQVILDYKHIFQFHSLLHHQLSSRQNKIFNNLCLILQQLQ
nr:MAG TPA: hypothetical protein [Bacteriophage sp.]